MNKAISCCRIVGKIDRSWKEEVERDYKGRRYGYIEKIYVNYYVNNVFLCRIIWYNI
jgi:hypothetical protein